jgi:hypothetical protein
VTCVHPMWSLHVADSLTRGSISPLVRMAWRVDVTFVVARTAVTHVPFVGHSAASRCHSMSEEAWVKERVCGWFLYHETLSITSLAGVACSPALRPHLHPFSSIFCLDSIHRLWNSTTAYSLRNINICYTHCNHGIRQRPITGQC